MCIKPTCPLTTWQDKHGVNNADLGERTGYNQSTIWRAKDSGRPSPDLRDALETVTGITANQWDKYRRELIAYAKTPKAKRKERCSTC